MFDKKSYMKEYHKKLYLRNKQKIDAQNTQYYQEHREEIIEYKKKWYKNNRDRLMKKQKEKYDTVIHKYKSIKQLYGMTADDYNKMFMKQGGKCAICGIHQNELGTSLHVDHDHNTGKVRGLICNRHNLALGMVHDNIDELQSMIKYLKRHAMKAPK